ncbi:MAG: hypothetical protein E7285_01645 [Lachnospiraceae bacterium]|nr:hypothetical protein [Lachnospiraceae bacterium]
MKAFKKLMVIAASAVMMVSLVACDKSGEIVTEVAEDYAAALADIDFDAIEEMSTEVGEDAMLELESTDSAVLEEALSTITYEVDVESVEASAKEGEGSIDVEFTYVDLEALAEDEDLTVDEDTFVDAIADGETTSVSVTLEFELDDEDWLVSNADDVIETVFDDLASFEISFEPALAAMIDEIVWYDTINSTFSDSYEFDNPYYIEADIRLNEEGVAAANDIMVEYIIFQNGSEVYSGTATPVEYTDGTFIEMPFYAYDDPSSDGMYVSAGSYTAEVYDMDGNLVVTSPTCTITNSVVAEPSGPADIPVSVEEGISPYAYMLEDVYWWTNNSDTLELDLIPADDYYYNDFVYTFMVFDSNNMDEPIYICDEFRTDSGSYLENYFYASDIGLDEFDPSVVYMMVVVDEAGDIVAYGTSDYDEFESIPQ